MTDPRPYDFGITGRVEFVALLIFFGFVVVTAFLCVVKFVKRFL